MGVVRRTLVIALVLASAVLLSLASGAQAARLHGVRGGLRWGVFTTRALGAHKARLGRRSAARPAVTGTGVIEGTVLDAVKGTGIEGIEVCAYPAEEPEEGAFEEEGLAPSCSRSRVGGDYTIGGLAPGEYVVEFSTPFNGTLDYITQYYDEAEAFGHALPVAVDGSEAVTGIDAALKKGGEVEGNVTKLLGGAPLEGIEVCAWGAEGASCAETNFEGRYVITGLPTASFKVEFRAPPGSDLNYVTQYYDDETSYKAANPVPVKVKAKTEGIDAAMAAGAEIEGTVTGGETGFSSAETLVCAFSESNGAVACAIADGFGGYTIEGLPSGSYVVAFLFAENGLPPEYYDEAFNESEATEVKLTAPEIARGINAEVPTLPKRIVAPHVTGSATVGGVLTCEEGAYSAVPAPTLTVQWLRNGEAIAGATSATYTVQAADAGHQLQCKVTATNVVGWLWVTTAGVPIPVPPAPTPPAPVGEVLSSVTVVPLVTAASHVTTPHHHASVRLKCSAGPCKGTLQLLVRVVSHHHARTVVLATGSFSLQAGASSSVTMHLTPAGRLRLAHDSSRAVAAKLKVSLQGGTTSTHAVSVT